MELQAQPLGLAEHPLAQGQQDRLAHAGGHPDVGRGARTGDDGGEDVPAADHTGRQPSGVLCRRQATVDGQGDQRGPRDASRLGHDDQYHREDERRPLGAEQLPEEPQGSLAHGGAPRTVELAVLLVLHADGNHGDDICPARPHESTFPARSYSSSSRRLEITKR